MWSLRRGTLTILAYHGVCEDRFGAAPWLPSYFVTASAFGQQLEYLSRRCCLLPLSEAVHRLRAGRLPSRAVALTFDDGYANTLHLACPLLNQRTIPATIFVATLYVETGEFFPFDRLRTIRNFSGMACADLPDYKNLPIDVVRVRSAAMWAQARLHMSPDQIATLRPLSVRELQSMAAQNVEFGGHTDSHCLLRNESAGRRRGEIELSIAKLHKWTGKPVVTFSYPNGQPGDMGELDRRTLAQQGVVAAVTTIAGTNSRSTDPLALRRFPVGLYHDPPSFAAEICGLRASLAVARSGR